VPFRKHPLVQNADHENALVVAPEEHYVAALFDAPAPRAEILASPTEHRILGNAVEAVVQPSEVPRRLSIAPAIAREPGDVVEVCSRSAAEAEARHLLSRASDVEG